MQEMQVQSLGWEDLLEKEMTIHSSILAWEIPWSEEPGGLQSTGLQRVGQDLVTKQQHTMDLSQSSYFIWTQLPNSNFETFIRIKYVKTTSTNSNCYHHNIIR